LSNKRPEFRQYRHEGLDRNHDGQDVIEQLAPWSRNRLRYRERSTKIIYDKNDPARSLGYALYRNALEAVGKKGLIEEFNLDNVVFNVQLAKQVSEYAKKGGPAVSKDWRYLVDVHRLGDYLEYKSDVDFEDEIRQWVGVKKMRYWDGNEEMWYQEFEKATMRVLFREGVSPQNNMSLETFFNNGDLWATSGSGYEPDVDRMIVYDVEKRSDLKVKKNKWSVRWQLSARDARKLMFKKRKQMCKAVQKSETGKVRAVISSDMSLYLKMTYISTFLDQIFKKRKDSTLWMTDQDRDELWQKMKPDGSWRMPIDQSSFDQNTTLRTVMIVVKCLRKLLVHFIHDSEAIAQILEIMDLIEYSIDGGFVIIGEKKIHIINGILSGWRWTAMLDTIVNLAELEMAIKFVQVMTGRRPKLLDFCAQGDDDWLKCERYADCAAIWLAYESFGLEVNPGKFFVALDRDEFLRRVYDRGKVTGYPARSITSIVFRSPLGDLETVGAGRIRESLTRWKLFADRMDRSFKSSFFERNWLIDSVQAVKGISVDIIKRWLETDPVSGGLGWEGGCQTGDLIPGSTITQRDKISVNTDGAKEWLEFAESYGVEQYTAEKFIAGTIEVAHNIKVPPWVKYIYTRDDLSKVGLLIPYGPKNNIPGSIAIGESVQNDAWFHKMRFFPSWSSFRNTSEHSPFGLEQPVMYTYEQVGALIMDSPQLLRPKQGVSRTLAQLSSDPRLVYEDAYTDLTDGKPKSWVKDFYAGMLKSPVPLMDGVGTDTVGAIAKRFLNSAIINFLRRSHPTLNTWRNLQRQIIKQTMRRVLDMPVRVVE
jgi:hypothetical protein